MRPHLRTVHRTVGNGYTSSRSHLVPALHPRIRAEEARDRIRTQRPIGKEARRNGNRPDKASAPEPRY